MSIVNKNLPKVYITTPIYYPSANPHLGHAYSTYLADAFKSYYQLCGYQVFFLTGLDEHGQKIAQAAEKANLSITDFLAQNARKFKDLWQLMGIEYDHFIRTTDPLHKDIVQKVFTQFVQLGLIYLGHWEGWYCISCEENYTQSQAIEKQGSYYCQNSHPLVVKNEPSYFFKMSHFDQWIKDYFKKHDFLIPSSRKKELINNFLAHGLPDLSVTRTSFSWGIPVPLDPKHVIYVWIDALFNYLSALGYLSDNDHLFQTYWNNPDTLIIHITAKEISRFHAIYWPILLNALGLRSFNYLISHGWILTNNTKMSKSLGNVIDPVFILKNFEPDGFRYYLLTLKIDQDNSFSYHELISTYRNVLVNGYGNLIARLAGMAKKYHNRTIPAFSECHFLPEIANLNQQLTKLINGFHELVKTNNLSFLLQEIFAVIDQTGKLIEDLKPWELYKQNKHSTVNGLLWVLYKIVAFATFAYQPICKHQYQKAISILDLANEQLSLGWFLVNDHFENRKIADQDYVLYPRIDLDYFDQLVKINNEQ